MVLGLGTSLGPGATVLHAAVRALALRVDVVAVSRIWASAPAGGQARGRFLNAAVLVQGDPAGLLRVGQALEARFGRRRGVRWADRTLDVDVLWAQGRGVRSPGLQVPHPRLRERDFALAPLLEVAPWAVDPVDGQRLADLARPRPHAWPVGVLPAVAAPMRRWYPHARLEQAGSHPMKFFIDTANLDDIRTAHSWGIIDGVTTNPSLIAKEGGDFVSTIAEICTIVDGPVSAEVVADTAEEMVAQGRLLARIHDNVVVKVPLVQEGIRATSMLTALGIKTNVTLCFSPVQALLAAKAGATYVSPFIGRVDDVGIDGMELIEQIVQIYSNYPELKTEILAASIRHPQHVLLCALAGADVATIPMATLKKLFGHPLTDIGNAKFTAAWDGVPDKDIVGQVTRWLDTNQR